MIDLKAADSSVRMVASSTIGYSVLLLLAGTLISAVAVFSTQMATQQATNTAQTAANATQTALTAAQSATNTTQVALNATQVATNAGIAERLLRFERDVGARLDAVDRRDEAKAADIRAISIQLGGIAADLKYVLANGIGGTAGSPASVSGQRR